MKDSSVSFQQRFENYRDDFYLLFHTGSRSDVPPLLLDERHLKRAYKSRIFDCHPDRLASLESTESQLLEKCSRINRAYNRLQELLKYGPVDTRVWLMSKVETSERVRQENSCIPKLGQFLVDRGLINKAVLYAALSWQNSRKPRFGSLANQLGYLTQDQITEAIRNQQSNELLGSVAIRMGLLTTEERDEILQHQAQQHQRLGDFLVTHGYLRQNQLDEALALHNEAAQSTPKQTPAFSLKKAR